MGSINDGKGKNLGLNTMSILDLSWMEKAIRSIINFFTSSASSNLASLHSTGSSGSEGDTESDIEFHNYYAELPMYRYSPSLLLPIGGIYSSIIGRLAYDPTEESAKSGMRPEESFKRFYDADREATSNTKPIDIEAGDRVYLSRPGHETKTYTSTSVLDAVAEAYSKAGIPLILMLGHPYKETTWGNPVWDKTRMLLTGKEPKTEKWVNNKDLYPELYSRYIDPYMLTTYSTPYIREIMALVRKYHNYDAVDDALVWGKYLDLFKLAAKEAKREITENSTGLDQSAAFFNTGKYNSGLKNYYDLVEKAGREMLEMEDVQKWLQSQDYYDVNKIEEDLANYKKAHPFFTYRYGGKLIPHKFKVIK